MPPTDPERRRWTLIAVCVTTFVLLLDITIVNVALPSIQRSLHASLTGLQWVVDAYALALAALILTAGALADRFGRRLLFAFGVIVFTASSFVCGVAWNIAALDVSRGVQGIGGAALFATALALISHEYRGRELFGAIAVWGATIGAAVASGPLIGGLLTDGLGWRWVFFVNVPVPTRPASSPSRRRCS
jgi:MFS family permease